MSSCFLSNSVGLGMAAGGLACSICLVCATAVFYAFLYSVHVHALVAWRRRRKGGGSLMCGSWPENRHIVQPIIGGNQARRQGTFP